MGVSTRCARKFGPSDMNMYLHHHHDGGTRVFLSLAVRTSTRYLINEMNQYPIGFVWWRPQGLVGSCDSVTLGVIFYSITIKRSRGGLQYS